MTALLNLNAIPDLQTCGPTYQSLGTLELEPLGPWLAQRSMGSRALAPLAPRHVLHPFNLADAFSQVEACRPQGASQRRKTKYQLAW